MLKSRCLASNDPSHYHLLRVLQSGGQSTVYEAANINSASFFALKIYHEASEHDRAFHNEVLVLSQAEHPGVPKFFGSFIYEGRQALALELLRGRSLSEILWYFRQKQRVFGVQASEMIAAELSTILAYLHTGLDGRSSPIVHGDISPDNIFITESGKLVLLDYGAVVCAPTQTSKRGAFGNGRYLAPELFLGSCKTPLSDMYAFGTLLFEILVARPFDDRRSEREFNCLKSILSDHEILFMTIRSCLAANPNFRPESIVVDGLIKCNPGFDARALFSDLFAQMT